MDSVLRWHLDRASTGAPTIHAGHLSRERIAAGPFAWQGPLLGSLSLMGRPDPDSEPPAPGEIDPRVRSAWRTWLSALASDAEAAMAAALAYDSLPDVGRDAWLDALEADAPTLDVPRIALYAPLLAVEADESRRVRIDRALDNEDRRPTSVEIRSLHGVASCGEHVCVIVSPLYLEFVQVLVCRYTPGGGFKSVRHDPMRHVDDVPGAAGDVDGVSVEVTPLRVVVEELAHAVLADRRARRAAPAELTGFAHLFGPYLDDGDRSER